MKAKSFYKNNKHNNMDSKEKENINEEELKAQDAQDETCEETTEKEEEAALTEEEKLAQELEKANAEIEDQKDKYLRLSAEFDNYRKRTMKEKAELILNGGEKSISSILPIVDDFERALKNMETATCRKRRRGAHLQQVHDSFRPERRQSNRNQRTTA